MILFFKTPTDSVIATSIDHQPGIEEKQALSWLYGGAQVLEEPQVSGFFIGPRREMITPWSTNAVEITQNMSLSGILRIEEFFPVDSEQAAHDPMLQRLYNGLDQQLFTVAHTPQPIMQVDDIEEYNEREGLALSPEEIAYLHDIERANGRRLTDSEIFGFAQINSEHCRHKIFGGTFVIDGVERPSSLFAMIKRTTKEHPGKIVSAYKDNVAFAQGPEVEQFAPENQATADWFRVKPIDSVISLKAETHNFPTTVEPFNGAATGTGGEIRDRMGGGVGSWPIAGTAVYMTSYPRVSGRERDCKWLYQSPQEILIKASNGASDFGNKFGQPLIAGSLLTFEYRCGEGDTATRLDGSSVPEEESRLYAYDKVIMLAGGVGYGKKRDSLKGTPRKGNRIVVVGGDNYRIGLGGGSVSSVDTGRYSNGIELNAVQRANPEMQKRAYNLVRALVEEDNNPVVSIHDHGSAGHLNCLSELVEDCGGKVLLNNLPIGDATLSAKEIIANESQERMGLLIDAAHLAHVQDIASRERAPLYVVGETTGDAHFSFEQSDGKKPFDLDVAQMFGHSPKTVMTDSTVLHHYAAAVYDGQSTDACLRGVLSLEAVACKDWLTNKVDRSVTGKVAQQQCVGELQLPLADCGVVALDFQGKAGMATAIGHAPQAGLADPQAGSVLSVAEALTNIVWAPIATDSEHPSAAANIHLSANWMWPCRSQEGEDARLYAAVEALSDFCCRLGLNVPTGKDSLSMTQQYPDGQKVISPGTVIVSSGAEVSNVRAVVTPVLRTEGASRLLWIDFCGAAPALGGSALAQSLGKVGSDVPYGDYMKKAETYADTFVRAFNAVQHMIQKGLVLAGHDVSAGGLATTLLEMTFANTQGGVSVDLTEMEGDLIHGLFAENPAVVCQIDEQHMTKVQDLLNEAGVRFCEIGVPTKERIFCVRKGDHTESWNIDDLRSVWQAPSAKLDKDQSFNGMAEERAAQFGKQPVEWVLPKGFAGKPTGWTPMAEKQREPGTGQRPKAAIIREKGTNGEREMAYAMYIAGFDVKDVMMTDLISGRETLEDIHFIVFCGGFSNSDVLGSAKGWAGAFLYNPKAKEALDKFYARQDTLSLGICNGCQLMIELDLIGSKDAPAALKHNRSGKFESAFLSLNIPENHSVLLGTLSGSKLGVWVAHGEGRFVLPDAEERYHVVAKYAYSAYPGNPNGSDYDVAGVCSADGRHLAMMPHPERAIFPWQTAFYPDNTHETTPWLEAFVNARKWVEAHA